MGCLYWDWNRYHSELEPTFSEATAIYLGHPADNPARLTSHDWITSESTPWNQSHVRQALNGKAVTGYWNVQVFEDAEYKISLRRWPEEADLSIASALAPAAAVPGAKAYRTTRGTKIQPTEATLQIGEVSVSADVEPGAKEVVFNIKLKAGRTRLKALFKTASGTEYGVYYAYVTRLTGQ